MPNIGEIKTGKELGHKAVTARLIWHACTLCGKERWVQLKRGEPSRKQCVKCSHIGKKPWLLKSGISQGSISNPVLDDTRYGREIGKKGTSLYIWLECPICNNLRWVALRNGKPRATTCLPCFSRQTLERINSQPKRPPSAEARAKISATLKGHPVSEETKRKLGIPIKQAWRNPEYRKARIAEKYKNWRTPSYVRNQMQARKVKPNKVEKRLMAILNQLYPNQWKYVGDGEVIIGGKCPDFININGAKAVIELFGTFWHSSLFAEAEKLNHYKRYGFDCVVIWENDVRNKKTIKAKLKPLALRERLLKRVEL